MKNLWNWFLASHRYQHLLGGILIGLLANDWYCAIYTCTIAAACLELKDCLWGGHPDWVDFAVTIAGSLIGYTLHFLVLHYAFSLFSELFSH